MIRHFGIVSTFLAALFLFSPLAVNAQAPPAGPGSSTNYGEQSLSSSAPASGQSSFSGSVPSKPVPGVLPLSLPEAIDRGLKQNLGLLLANEDIRSARGSRWQQLSSLLPNVTTSSYINVSQVNLQEFGFNFNIPGT